MEFMIKAKFYANLDDPGILQMKSFAQAFNNGTT